MFRERAPVDGAEREGGATSADIFLRLSYKNSETNLTFNQTTRPMCRRAICTSCGLRSPAQARGDAMGMEVS